MKLLLPITAIFAVASAGQIYSNQPEQGYVSAAEAYQSQLEYQQQGLYSDQSHYAGHEDSHERPTGEKTAKILSYSSESDGHGYQYSYETDNGIKAQEVGQTHHDKGTEAHGAYSYTGDDGKVYTVTYTADEHGFRAEGHHLPTPPPVPEAIAKALEQNAKDEAAGVFDDGKYEEQNHHDSNQLYHESNQGYIQSDAYQGSHGAHQAAQEFHHQSAQEFHHQPAQGHQVSQEFHHQPAQSHQVSQEFHHQPSQGHASQSYQGHQAFQGSHHHQQNIQASGYHQQFEGSSQHEGFRPSGHIITLSSGNLHHKH